MPDCPNCFCPIFETNWLSQVPVCPHESSHFGFSGVGRTAESDYWQCSEPQRHFAPGKEITAIDQRHIQIQNDEVGKRMQDAVGEMVVVLRCGIQSCELTTQSYPG